MRLFNKPKTKRALLARLMIYGGALLLLLYAAIEPRWVHVRTLRLNDTPSCKLVHFSDLHYKGNRRALDKLIQQINAIDADFVCFTGDIVENTAYLDDALETLKKIHKPVFGVPGNHEYWSKASFEKIAAAFADTGGGWLNDAEAPAPLDGVQITGITSKSAKPAPPNTAAKHILLSHYPDIVDRLDNSQPWALILAGHSHGGQVRLPFWGALLVPYGVGPYSTGLFHTPAGPLYVNPGIGTWFLPLRFWCPPETTIIHL